MQKNNPFTLLQNYTKNKSTQKPQSKPKWIPAISLFPPAPKPLYSANPLETGAFLPENYQSNLNQLRIDRSVFFNNKEYKSMAFKPKVFTKVHDIVYPEDSLRNQFYEKHTAELERPVCAVETDESLGENDWSSIHGGKV